MFSVVYLNGKLQSLLSDFEVDDGVDLLDDLIQTFDSGAFCVATNEVSDDV